MFALTLAPFLGVLVGGGLIQLAFGWDAAPVRVSVGLKLSTLMRIVSQAISLFVIPGR